jgi:hypothetical protein
MGHMNGLMVEDMKVNTSKTKDMVMEQCVTAKNKNIGDNGNMAKNMDKEFMNRKNKK